MIQVAELRIENIADILFDGPETDIQQLFDKGVAYQYDPSSSDFFVDYGTEAVTYHKCPEVPFCVKAFGDSCNMKS